MSDDKRLQRMETKLDDIDDSLGIIEVTLAAQHETLKEHIKRSTMLENDLKPIRRHVYMVQGAGALIVLLATIASIIKLFG